MKRISIFLVAGLAGLLLADETKPGPRPEQPFNRYDLAVIDIDTTGPNGQPKYAPVITIRNTGSAFINRDLAVEYWSNGVQVLIGGDPIHIALQPGQTVIWRGGILHENLVHPGDVVKAVIDCKNQLAELNENNNTLTKKVRLVAVRPRN